MTRILLTALAMLSLLVTTAAPARAYEEVGKPLGTWTRIVTVDGVQVRVRIEVTPDTIRLSARSTKGPVTETLTVVADYFATRDGVIMGMVPLGKKKTKDAGNEALKETFNKRGFMCRFKLEKQVLVISDVMIGGDLSESTTKALEGKYHKVEDRHDAARRKSEPPPVVSSGYPTGPKPVPFSAVNNK